MNISHQSIPWVEKYRPQSFEDIVLPETTRIILKSILSERDFPNILLYGPPGTGKTTSVLNIIKAYQKKYNEYGKDLVMHLNASDDRGIDVIRTQILSFVSSSSLFRNGHKFIVLDEVDYMTKNAQQALSYLVKSYRKNITFCLICNYSSRVDPGLQSEFLKFRFHQLPKDVIYDFLHNICQNEKIDIDKPQIENIISYYKSDIRSMINHIQLNKHNLEGCDFLPCSEKFQHIKSYLMSDDATFTEYSKDIYNMSVSYNISRREVVYIMLQFLYCSIKEAKHRVLQIIDILFHTKFTTEQIILYSYYMCKTSLFSVSSK